MADNKAALQAELAKLDEQEALLDMEDELSSKLLSDEEISTTQDVGILDEQDQIVNRLEEVRRLQAPTSFEEQREPDTDFTDTLSEFAGGVGAGLRGGLTASALRGGGVDIDKGESVLTPAGIAGEFVGSAIDPVANLAAILGSVVTAGGAGLVRGATLARKAAKLKKVFDGIAVERAVANKLKGAKKISQLAKLRGLERKAQATKTSILASKAASPGLKKLLTTRSGLGQAAGVGIAQSVIDPDPDTIDVLKSTAKTAILQAPENKLLGKGLERFTRGGLKKTAIRTVVGGLATKAGLGLLGD